MDNIRDIKIKALENQVKELQEVHKQLAEHYHEFAKATVQYLKETAEEEWLLKTAYAKNLSQTIFEILTLWTTIYKGHRRFITWAKNEKY